METAQTFANHRKLVPLFHGFVLLSLLVNFGWAVYRLIGDLSGDHVVNLLLASALIVLALFTRAFPVKAQDRIIRLEMQLRLRERLPAELQPRIHDFTPAQLIALRFAGDDELPTLAARVLKDDIRDATTIKKMITQWRADHLRV